MGRVKFNDLAMRISCYKEAQILDDKDRERQELLASGRFVSSVVKRIEVCFKEASWVLTDSDGQLRLADITLTNFLYTKVAKNDDSVEQVITFHMTGEEHFEYSVEKDLLLLGFL